MFLASDQLEQSATRTITGRHNPMLRLTYIVWPDATITSTGGYVPATSREIMA